MASPELQLLRRDKDMLQILTFDSWKLSYFQNRTPQLSILKTLKEPVFAEVLWRLFKVPLAKSGFSAASLQRTVLGSSHHLYSSERVNESCSRVRLGGMWTVFLIDLFMAPKQWSSLPEQQAIDQISLENKINLPESCCQKYSINFAIILKCLLLICAVSVALKNRVRLEI